MRNPGWAFLPAAIVLYHIFRSGEKCCPSADGDGRKWNESVEPGCAHMHVDKCLGEDAVEDFNISILGRKQRIWQKGKIMDEGGGGSPICGRFGICANQ